MAEYGKLDNAPASPVERPRDRLCFEKSQSLLKEAVELSPGCSNLVKTTAVVGKRQRSVSGMQGWHVFCTHNNYADIPTREG